MPDPAHPLAGLNDLNVFSRLTFLGPGREVRTLVDASAAYFARGEAVRFTATIRYRDERGRAHRHRITHDLSVYADLIESRPGPV